MLNYKHFVVNTNILDSAEDMDSARQKQVAYEYLCHLEEAKKWVTLDI